MQPFALRHELSAMVDRLQLPLIFTHILAAIP
jgi:hypothetical protein